MKNVVAPSTPNGKNIRAVSMPDIRDYWTGLSEPIKQTYIKALVAIEVSDDDEKQNIIDMLIAKQYKNCDLYIDTLCKNINIITKIQIETYMKELQDPKYLGSRLLLFNKYLS